MWAQRAKHGENITWIIGAGEWGRIGGDRIEKYNDAIVKDRRQQNEPQAEHREHTPSNEDPQQLRRSARLRQERT